MSTKDVQEFGRRLGLDNRESLMTARSLGVIPTRRGSIRSVLDEA